MRASAAGMRAVCLLLFASSAGAFVPTHTVSLRPRCRVAQPFIRLDEQLSSEARKARKRELDESDADSADSGPKILMPPEELLNVMPSEADSFAGYLLPYAGLVLLAFALASGAFALLVLNP